MSATKSQPRAPGYRPPREPGPGKGAERVLRGIHRFVAGFMILQLAFVGVFLLTSPWWAVTSGLPGAAMLLAALGLLFDWRAFDVLLEWLPARAQKFVVRLSMLAHLSVFVAGAWLVTRPIDPAWELQPGTDGVSDPILAFRPDGALLVHGGAGSVRYQGDDGGWYDLDAPGFFGWELHATADGALYVGPSGMQRIDRYDPTARTWRAIGRPGGYLADMSVGSGELLAAIAGRLHRLDMVAGTWSEEQALGRVNAVALAPDGDGALAAGERWWARERGAWADVTPPAEQLGFPNDAVIGGGGWRYVLLGGFLAGDLHVAGPGEGFRKVEAPAGDLRVLVADPVRGELVIAGSWGQGVWVSRDGAASWAPLGLERVQVRSLAVDWRRGRVCAASSNLLWDKGVFCRRLPGADGPPGP